MNPIESFTDAGLGLIVLSNPDGGNLLNRPFLEAFIEAFDRFTRDPGVRVILYRSSKEVFCHGMDLSSVSVTLGDGGDAEVREAIGLYSKALERIVECPKPVFAFLRGEVKAGGFGLACAADAVVATPGANFELAEVIFGLIPANVMHAIQSLRVAPNRLKYLVLTSKKIYAEEAMSLGLVDELFPEETAEKSLKDILKRVFRSSPEALRETKAFMRVLLEKDYITAGDAARKKILDRLAEPEVRRALKGYLEGDMPSWFSSFKPALSLTGIGG